VSPLGIVAGGGSMPLRVAEAVRRTGRPVCVVLLDGFADPALWREVAFADRLALGQIGRLVGVLRAAGVQDVVMCGRVERPSLSALRFDAEGAKLVARLGPRAMFGGDDALLRRALELVRELGFNPMGAQEVLGALLVEEGQLGRHAPDEAAWVDIRRGAEVALALGRADVGQGCVVQQGLVLAVEAIEGTDAMLARAGGLMRAGGGGVLVKLVKPRQDRRIDLPVIGPDTVAAAAAAGLAGIALEARQNAAGTILLERDATIAAADAAGLFLQAIRPTTLLKETET